MKITWIADFQQNQRAGGSQMTDRYLINYAKFLNHKVDELGLFNINNLENIDSYLSRYDCIILSNYYELDRTEKGSELINKLQKHKYIRYIHDYDGYYTGNVDIERKKTVIESSVATICLSPAHMQETIRLLAKAKEMFCVPSFIDTDKFFNADIKDKIYKSITFGEIAKHKGIYNLMKLHRKYEQIDFYTHNVNQDLKLGNILIKPAINYELVNNFLNKYKTFVFYPEWIEPFGRTVAEAYLSGIDMDVDKNKIGFYSYDWDYNNKQEVISKLKTARQDFWQLVISLNTI